MPNHDQDQPGHGRPGHSQHGHGQSRTRSTWSWPPDRHGAPARSRGRRRGPGRTGGPGCRGAQRVPRRSHGFDPRGRRPGRPGGSSTWAAGPAPARSRCSGSSAARRSSRWTPPRPCWSASAPRPSTWACSDAIRTVRADLDDSWPAVGPVDLVWASASMHHMADPDRVLADIFGAIRPGGLLAVAELDSFPRFLSGDLGDGLEERCHAVLAEARARDLPHIGDDWGTRLAQGRLRRRAGPDLHHRPDSPAARCHRPVRPGFAGPGPDRARGPDQRRGPGHARRAPGRDGPESILHRDDLRVRTTRTLLLARRP